MKNYEFEIPGNKTAKDIFEEQIRIMECCAHVKGDEITMSLKYFSEMLVRPGFGDSDDHYDKLCEITEDEH